jgi:DNA-directed RNA polymerase specialized sigma24 family protein
MARLTEKRWLLLHTWASILARDVDLQRADEEDLREALILKGAETMKQTALEGDELRRYVFVCMRRERSDLMRQRMAQTCLRLPDNFDTAREADLLEPLIVEELSHNVCSQLRGMDRRVFQALLQVSRHKARYGVQRHLSRELGVSKNTVNKAVGRIREALGFGPCNIVTIETSCSGEACTA